MANGNPTATETRSVQISSERFDEATQRIDSAKNIILALSIFASNEEPGSIEVPSPKVLNGAFYGAVMMLEDAMDMLVTSIAHD